MSRLRVLILEDSATDAELALFELERAGLDAAQERVSTRDGFIRALQEFRPDIVLADYSLPNFDGNAALQWMSAHHPHIPIIIVTGALGDELAIELIKAGARDYVLKSNLVRLGPAVLRALAESAQVAAREQAERAAAAAAAEREKLLASLELRVQERTAQLRAMAFELSKTEERERQAIARDLHDSLGQTLAIAKIRLDALRLTIDDAETNRSLSAIVQLIDQSNRSVRSLAAQLSPSVLYDLGLVPALEWLAEEKLRDFGLRCRISADTLPQPLDAALSSIMFRAVQELMVNVVKHADAAAPVDISVSVVPADDWEAGNLLEIIVRDSGKGFDPNTAKPTRHSGFGLMSVRERLAHVGGTVDIDSAPGRGTTVTLIAPLHTSAG